MTSTKYQAITKKSHFCVGAVGPLPGRGAAARHIGHDKIDSFRAKNDTSPERRGVDCLRVGAGAGDPGFSSFTRSC